MLKKSIALTKDVAPMKVGGMLAFDSPTREANQLAALRLQTGTIIYTTVLTSPISPCLQSRLPLMLSASESKAENKVSSFHPIPFL